MIFICHYFYIYCINIPLNRIHSEAFDRADGRVIVVAVGWAEQCWRSAGDRSDFLIAGGQFRRHLFSAQLWHMGMDVGMVFDSVSRVVKLFDRFGVLIDPGTHHKECCRNFVFF